MAHASFKKIFPLFLLLLTVTWPSRAQDDSNPVHWGTAVEKTGDGIYDIRFTARIDSPWHMYDMGLTTAAPTPLLSRSPRTATIRWSAKHARRANRPKNSTRCSTWRSALSPGVPVFVQQVKLVPPAGGARIAVNIEWMACDETSCLPPADGTSPLR